MLSVDEKSLLITTMTMKMRKLKTCQGRLESGVIVWDCGFLCKAAQALHERPPSTYQLTPTPQSFSVRLADVKIFPKASKALMPPRTNSIFSKKLRTNSITTTTIKYIVYNAQKLKAIEGETFPYTKKLKFLFAPSQLSVYYLESRNHHRLGSLSQAGTRGVPVQLRWDVSESISEDQWTIRGRDGPATAVQNPSLGVDL